MIKTKCVFRYMILNWSNLSQVISRKPDHWGMWVWFLHYPPWNVQEWFTLAPVCLQTTSHGSLHPPSLPLPQWLLFLSCQHCSCIINILTLWEGLWWLSGKWIGSAFLNSLTAEGWQRDYKKSGPDRQQKASRVAKEMVSSFLFATGSVWVEEVWSWVRQVRISKMWNSSSYGFLHWVAPWSL